MFQRRGGTDVLDVGYSGRGMFGIGDIQDKECLGCGM